MHIGINIKLFEKINEFCHNNSMMLILLAIDYTKMIMFGKLNIAVTIITMLEKDGSYCKCQ
jgi:hypothetical protein